MRRRSHDHLLLHHLDGGGHSILSDGTVAVHADLIIDSLHHLRTHCAGDVLALEINNSLSSFRIEPL